MGYLTGAAAPIAALSTAGFLFAATPASGQGAPSAVDTTSPGAVAYAEHCASCHDHPIDRIPPRNTISMSRPPEYIARTVTEGVMKANAAGLTKDQIAQIAVFLTGKQFGSTPQPDVNANRCTTKPGPITLNGSQWNGWGHDSSNSRYQPEPGFTAAQVPNLKVKWAFAYPGFVAYGQPTVVGDRLFVTSQMGQVFSLDAKTGCTQWVYDAGAPVRTAVNVGPAQGAGMARFAAYFGDDHANVFAVNAETGKLLWKVNLDKHPIARITGAPRLFGKALYVPVASLEELSAPNPTYICCTFRGSVAKIDVTTGKVLWHTYTITTPAKPFKKNAGGKDMYGPAGGSIWSPVTIDPKRGLVYVGVGNSYTDAPTVPADITDSISAFDMETGRRAWSTQGTPNDNFLAGCGANRPANCPGDPAGPDFDFGSPAILQSLPGGKQILLAGQKSGVMYGMDPDQKGKILWQARVGEGSALGGIEYGSAADEHTVYVANSDVSLRNGHLPGGLTALDPATGKVIWHTPAPEPVCSWGKMQCTAAQGATVAVIPGVVFSGSMDGHIRGYSTADGKIVWDYDTGRSFDAINGVKATGGSVNGYAEMIANGVLYVSSGQGLGAHPGNLLLAFTVDGK